jgi:deoxyribonucleoside regulator
MTRPTEEYEELMLRAAELYHYERLTQSAVAEQLGTTRWTVGRLLDDARNSGLVKVVIDHPRARRHDLELQLQQAYGLKGVVVLGARPNAAVTMASVCAAAARHLVAIRPSIARIAVSWGRTVAGIAAELPVGWARNPEVVQTNGGPTTASGNPVGDSLYVMANKGGGRVRGLAAPTMVEDARLAALLRDDRAIQSTLKAAEACRVMLYSPGAAAADSVLVQSGYRTAEQMEALGQAGAVADVMSHFILSDGTPVDPELDARTLSLSLDAVRRCPTVIAVATGEEKKAATVVAVTAGFCTTLITDSSIAAALLTARGPD